MVFMVALRNFLYNIVEEKAEKFKETQRIMGVKDSAYQLSWILYITLKSFIVNMESYYTQINLYSSHNVCV